jgi:hypothetical protein
MPAAGFLETQVEGMNLNALRIFQQADTLVSLRYVLKDGKCPVFTPAIEDQNFILAGYVSLREQR